MIRKYVWKLTIFRTYFNYLKLKMFVFTIDALSTQFRKFDPISRRSNFPFGGNLLVITVLQKAGLLVIVKIA